MVSARMLHPAVMGATNAVSRSLPCGRQVDRIKRNLFGAAPTEPKTVSNSFSAQLESLQEQASQKWGFDFRADCPLADNSRFMWWRVSTQESNYAPQMYTLTRAAHVRRDSLATASDMDALLNERADRENLANSSLDSQTDNEYDSQDEPFNSSSGDNVVASTSAAALIASSSRAATSNSPAQQRKRQLKITEFMKERKRLAQAPKKISPAKRMRTSSGSNPSSSSSSTIGAHFGSLLKRTRHN